LHQHLVLFTKSRGTHTRTLRNPSTIDFGGAVIDWYLIGEADVGVGDPKYTFGGTAAMRTALPLYGANQNCSSLLWLQE